ncbi:MAG TPA: nitrilase-related carbon-nitrogen hydrolase [Ktedonobacteraceae bacterium]|nr:nitrilase-related carbon-nitrogen hydrolase [Ktedonobacteraceae bacterium]
MKKRLHMRQAIYYHRYLWLAFGTILSLFAANGRWDIPLAAWLYPLFFLRFTRSSRSLIGLTGVWLASAGSMLFFFYESQVFNPILVGACLIISAIMVLPYLFDRLLVPRLSLVSGLLATLAFPLSRVIVEYFTTNVLLVSYGSLFSLAYTQYGNLALLQIISITGVYGVSFLIAWFASVCNWIWEQDFAWPRIRKITLFYSGLLALILLGGSIRLTFFSPSAQTVRVAGISVPASIRQQALSNFSTPAQRAHADPAQLRPALAIINDELLKRSQSEARAGAKIVVWPEAGAVTLIEDEAQLVERGNALAQQESIYLEMGLVVLQDQGHSLKALRDRTILLDPQGRVVWIYDKAHPVPGMESFAPGSGKLPVVETPYGRIASVICFDADFPDLMRQAGNNGVDIMLVPGNDWQGIDPMHTHDATFRAIENGYSLVRQASNGLAMTVDYQGHALAASDYFTTDAQTMIAYVPVKGVWTVYALVGDLFAWLCIIGLLALGGWVTLSILQRSLPASASSSKPSSINTEDKNKVGTGKM